jgi:hypothetical protein
VRICITGAVPHVVPASRVPGAGNGVPVLTLDQIKEQRPLEENVVYNPRDPDFPLGGLDIEYRRVARACAAREAEAANARALWPRKARG